MDLIQGIMQPPKAQSVEETIPTLCDRLENATLISDRRSAVLGLKSFSREYRETVIASGLKTLVSTLLRDQGDDDLVKALLETLLILFIRGEGQDDLTRNWISQQSRLQNGKYPSPLVMKEENEPVDQFSLWITDALTQTDEIIRSLFLFLESKTFHIRLYTIQLLEALISTRPLRTREVILNIPTGVSTLVGLLTDVNEPIRDEAILLLMAVVNDNSHFQKLVAFENIFETLFSIIDDEGGLRGSLVVNDCLSLINNILRYNTSNQTLFFETGNLAHIMHLLREPLSQEEEFFWNEQRLKNVKTVLDIIRLTVEEGNTVTPSHQDILFNADGLTTVLRLAFFIHTPNTIRLDALSTAADLVKDNLKVQESFGQIDVPYWDPSLPSNASPVEPRIIPVVHLLLEWTLYLNSVHIFDIRVASLELLKAYFSHNDIATLSFLASQIKLFKISSGEIEPEVQEDNIKANVFESVFNYDPNLNLNPYKLFFSTDILMYFMLNDSDDGRNRALIRNINLGDASTGEEVLYAVQSVGELLLTTLTSQDIRIPIAFLSFLVFWLFEDPESVNDFLSSKSLINNLVSFSLQIQEQDISIKCLATLLLGVSYEFSSSDSPFSRKDLYTLLVSRIGIDNYSSRVRQFKETDIFSNSKEQYFDPSFDETGLPRIYFSKYFVNMINKNFRRILTALKRSPDEEANKKITFEVYDQVHNELSVAKKELLTLKSDSATTIESLNEQLNSLNKSMDLISEEKEANESRLKEFHQKCDNLAQVLKETETQLSLVSKERDELIAATIKNEEELNKKTTTIKSHNEMISKLKKDLLEATDAKKRAEDGINKMSREMFALKKENDNFTENIKSLNKLLEEERKKSSKNTKKLDETIAKKDKEIEDMKNSMDSYEKKTEDLERSKSSLLKQLEELESKFASQDTLIPKLTEKLKSLANSFKELENERDNLQNQLSESKDSSEKQLNDIKENLRVANTQKDGLTDKMKSMQEEYHLKLTAFERHEKELDAELVEKKSDIQKVQTLLKEIKASNTLHLEAKKRLEDELKNIKERCSSLEKSLEEAKAMNEKSDGTIDDLHDSMIAINDELQSVLGERNELKITNARLSKQLEVKIKCLRETEGKNENLSAEVKELNYFHSKIMNEKNQALKKLEAEKEHLLEEIKSLRNDYDNLDVKFKKSSSNLSNDIKILEKNLAQSKELQEKGRIDLESLKRSKNDLEASKAELEICLKDKNKECQDYNAIISQSKLDVGKHQETIKNLNSSIESKELELSSRETEIQSLTSKLEELSKIIKSKDDEIAKLKDEIDDLQDKLKREQKKTKEEHVKLTTSLENMRSEIKSKVEDFEKERKLLNEGSSSLNQEYSNKISALEEQLEKTKSRYEQRLEEHETEKDKINQDLDEVSNELKHNKKQLSNLEASNSALQAQLSEKESSIISLSTKLTSLEKERSEEVSNVQTQLESAKNASEDLKKKLEESEKQIKSLHSDLKAFDETSANKEREFKKNTKMIEKLSGQTLNDKKTIESLSEKIEKLQNELSEQKSNSEFSTKVISSLKADISALKLDLKTVTEGHDGKSKQLGALEKENQKLSSKLAEAQAKQDSLKDKVYSLKISENDLNTRLTEIQEKSAQLRQSSETKILKLTQRNTDLLDQVELQKKECETWKMKAEDRSEIDELMILVTDLDERNSKYKEKLLELGVELSSDDESDDENESDSDKYE